MKSDKDSSKKKINSLQEPRKVRLSREAESLQKKLADYRYVPHSHKTFQKHEKLTKELDTLANASETKNIDKKSLTADSPENIKTWFLRFQELRIKIWDYVTKFENKNTLKRK